MEAAGRLRVLAATVAVAGLAVGWSASGSTIRASKARVAEIRNQEVSAEDAQKDALARRLNFVQQEGFFDAELRDDLAKWNLPSLTVERLKQPNAFSAAVERPLMLAPGSRWTSDHVQLKAVVEKVTFQQRGAAVAARHSVVLAENISDVPIAYDLRVGPDDGRLCKARGARMHNAMALWPGEIAEIVVCAGGGSVRVQSLRVLEVTPVGYHYVSQLPPVAVGHDAVTGQAHRPPAKTTMCTRVPAVRLAEAIKAGQVRWEDVVDFYSRHDCDAHQYVPGYRRAETSLSVLPVADSRGS